MSAQLEELVGTEAIRLALVKARLEGLRYDALAPVVARVLHVPEKRAWEIINGITEKTLREIPRQDGASLGAAIREVLDGEPEPEPAAPVREYPFPCTYCEKGFDTKQGRSMHVTKVHGEVKDRPARHLEPAPQPVAEAPGDPPRANRPEVDPEVYAIGYAVPLLEPLDQPGRRRVLDYLAQRFVVDAEKEAGGHGA